MSRSWRQQAQDQGTRVASVAVLGEDSAPAPWVLAGASSLSPPAMEGQGLHGSLSRDLHG